ncbi:protein cornichon homolog 4-like isoform X1 [Saccostrea echinata]|uniref:protein cornichon homolog 4-like isoform X1 n=1 Tax=Saccostrea echinata TaxID=191078 RepID=UPI002A7FC669|nr:protein cornichon homolog 4-like isoform X1 [Saccostrea echinata]
MGIDGLLFLLAVIDEGALLFLVVYFVITLSDLECDYLNATTCCTRLNKFVLPEIIAQAILNVLFLITGHWILFLLYTPCTAWIIYIFVTKPSGNIGIYDPAEIHNRHQLKAYMRDNMIKMAVHLIFFFIFLYWMIYSLLKDDTTMFGVPAEKATLTDDPYEL